ncbi:HsdR family type I site-specific deoxyribonuclease [Chryseolinea sp. H1M3-3]|uniref:type I restriction endonuclease subunit R n=1 Tax=Chryseolinea sp. H1M3-3 TaxID=3034144 RepID=UPI0023EC65AD|nr:HsdR family type I site-specific deoxyribonuclease [Chryseolinea sp. H1M3-3]
MIVKSERDTQNRIINLFQKQLKYRYLGNWYERENNSNIEEDILISFLRDKKKYDPTLINKAIFDFKKAASDQSNDLYNVNKSVYSLLRYGIKVKGETGDQKETVFLIDWHNPLENDFAIAEEVTVKGERIKRPDLVLYVNGIALCVIELKKGSIPVSEAIRQNLDNQENRFIKRFYSTVQLVLAGNDTQGIQYGTTKTSEKFFLKWKEENYTYKPEENLLDTHLLQMCEKERLIEMIHNFILFDGGIKKLCRPNQFFGVKESQKFIQRKEGGIIWHTQGSGKSLTMVWLAKWIRENVQDSRLLILTDRTELDEQIEGVFLGVEEKIYRTKSGRDLIEKLNATQPWLLCSLIHKFGGSDDDSYEFITELKVPQDFKPKGDLFVFIDECHRSQSGELHKAMKKILPDALFIGFTGTPLLKSDKKKSIEIFGRYIHTYKFDEAVTDGVVLDLLYEARDVDQHVLDQKGLDDWFEMTTKGMNDLPKAELKQKWGTMQKVLSTKSRLEKIVFDIIKDFKIKPRLRTGNGNAMLVARSIYEACRYYEIFQNMGFKKCAIITSFEPNANSTKGETTGDGDTEKIEQYEIYQKMLNGRDRETFEKEAKKKFKDEPANMQLLIVVDKLLTGFDAPSCTYLYIDKQMQDHGLFQAICRVNRTEKEDKEFGYIVDYKNLFDSLNKSINDYTSDAFENFDKSDIDGLLKDRLTIAKERLDDALETMHQLLEPVSFPKQLDQHIAYFCGNTQDPDILKSTEEKRLALYKETVSLIRAYNNLASEMTEAGYSEREAEEIKKTVCDYTELRNSIKIASNDYIDLKKYEPEMRQMLDMYLSADPSRMLSNFDDMSLLQLIVEEGIGGAIDKLPKGIKASKSAMAETIENNMRKAIIQEMPINPAYYEKMSVLLAELIRLRKEGSIAYEEQLKKYEELAKKIKPKGTSIDYPDKISTEALRALYDNLEKDEKLSVLMDADIQYTKKDNWVGNTIKEREVKNVVRKYVKDPEKVETIFEIIKNQRDYK